MRIRSDLILSRQLQRGAVCIIVKDPATRRFFRFGEPEEFIIRHLDGVHTRESIRQKCEERFNGELPDGALDAFIDRLAALGLLNDGTHARYVPPRQSILYIRFRAFDPERALTWLLPKTRIFFGRRFLWLSCALLLLATALTLANSGDIARETPRLLGGSSLVLIWLTAAAVGCAHEFAHGLTCKRYGGEVRDMGFMLLFFMPAFYCNVSDAWLFPKRQRLIVLVAGAYAHLVLWAAAVLVWRVTPADTVPHLLALVVMAVCGIQSLFNLNPLIKLDGYYMLSDQFEIPNLRRRAFAYVRATVLGRLRGTGTTWAGTASARERRIYLIYGLLAGVYSFALLGFIAMRFGGLMVRQFQGIGVVLFMGLLMAIFKKPLSAMRARMSNWFVGPPVPSGHGRKRYRSVKRKRTIQLAAVAGAVAFLVLGRLELRVAGEFRVEPSHNADIRAAVDGIIGEIPVREGEIVQQGQVIAKLIDRDLRMELRRVDADLTTSQATLDMLRAGPRREEIDLARAEVRAAETARGHTFDRYQEARRRHAERAARAQATLEKATEQLSHASAVLEQHRNLFDRQLIARVKLDEAALALNVKEKELQEARAVLDEITADRSAEMRGLLTAAEEQIVQSKGRLAVLLAGTRPEQIDAVAAEVGQLIARRAYVEEQLRLTELTSPIAGVVTTPKMEEKVGQHVNRGDLVAEVYDLTSVIAELSIPEQEIADVNVGDRVVLKARAFVAEEFEGQVVSIAPAMTKDAGPIPAFSKTIRVTTRIANPRLRLKPDMTGVAKIDCGRRTIIDLMTRRLARYLRVEFWSYW